MVDKIPFGNFTVVSFSIACGVVFVEDNILSDKFNVEGVSFIISVLSFDSLFCLCFCFAFDVFNFYIFFSIYTSSYCRGR